MFVHFVALIAILISIFGLTQSWISIQEIREGGLIAHNFEFPETFYLAPILDSSNPEFENEIFQQNSSFESCETLELINESDEKQGTSSIEDISGFYLENKSQNINPEELAAESTWHSPTRTIEVDSKKIIEKFPTNENTVISSTNCVLGNSIDYYHLLDDNIECGSLELEPRDVYNKGIQKPFLNPWDG